MYNTSYKTKMCLAEFKGFAQLCLCRRVRIRNFVFPALVTAFSPRALLGFGVFKLRRVLFRKVPNVESQTVYQFRGCYWHGHDCALNCGKEVNEKRNKPMTELLEETRANTEHIRSKDYRVVEMWECE